MIFFFITITAITAQVSHLHVSLRTKLNSIAISWDEITFFLTLMREINLLDVKNHFNQKCLKSVKKFNQSTWKRSEGILYFSFVLFCLASGFLLQNLSFGVDDIADKCYRVSRGQKFSGIFLILFIKDSSFEKKSV